MENGIDVVGRGEDFAADVHGVVGEALASNGEDFAADVHGVVREEEENEIFVEAIEPPIKEELENFRNPSEVKDLNVETDVSADSGVESLEFVKGDFDAEEKDDSAQSSIGNLKGFIGRLVDSYIGAGESVDEFLIENDTSAHQHDMEDSVENGKEDFSTEAIRTEVDTNEEQRVVCAEDVELEEECDNKKLSGVDSAELVSDNTSAEEKEIGNNDTEIDVELEEECDAKKLSGVDSAELVSDNTSVEEKEIGNNDTEIDVKLEEECDDKKLGGVDSAELVSDNTSAEEKEIGNNDTEIADRDPFNGPSLSLSVDKIDEELQTEENLSISRHSEQKEDEVADTRIVNETKVHSDKELKETSLKSRTEITEEAQEQSILMDAFEESTSTVGDDEMVSSSRAAPPTEHRDNSGGPSLPSRPAGLGSSIPLLEPTSRSLQQTRGNGTASLRSSQLLEEIQNEDAEENDETREKLQMIRVKFLRLARRLGQTPHNVVVAQVLYRLGLAEQLRKNTNRPGVFSFDKASIVAEQLEAAGQEPLDFSCTIMVLGKTGVGKSSTINSIFDDAMLPTDAFQQSTKKVQEIVGTVQGIRVKVIDTPGLFSSASDQCRNEKILRSVKRFISKNPPDIVLYCDRLDMQSRDYGDIPLLRTITDIFGASIWFNAIVVLTHAASAPPDGPTGNSLSYEMFVTQRSHVVQQAIRQAAGDVRLMNPVSLVENHSACRMNRAGQRVLPNGQVWKPQLLLLSFSSKILAEANTLLKLQDNVPGRPFGARQRVPPLPFLLSSLLQSRPQLKLPEENADEDDNLDEILDETSDSDGGSDYEELPPFKPLSKLQIEKLSKAQRKAYFEELNYREKLFYKKQLKDEKQRRKFAKKMADMQKDLPDDPINENLEDESNSHASVPVPMPDFVLPNSFDSDNPSYRYRFLDSSSQWLVRPVLDSQGWDHDIGYEGLNVEKVFVIKEKIPVSVSGQLTKDKKDCAIQMELASSIKHSENKTSSLGLDMQTVGKDIAYTVRGESRFTNFRRNNTAAGISVTVLGDSVSAGLKIEDKLIVNKRFRVLMSGGAMTGRGDIAYGGRLEATLRDKDFPIGRFLSTIALSVVDWHGDLALGCNIQSQLPVGRGTNVVLHSNLSNKGMGQVGIRMNSSEHVQLALVALVPVLKHVMRMVLGSSQSA